jgi:hypothetical protein
MPVMTARSREIVQSGIAARNSLIALLIGSVRSLLRKKRYVANNWDLSWSRSGMKE